MFHMEQIADMADSPTGRGDISTRYVKGQPSANPGGKATGARNRLTKHYLNALADDFEKHGPQAIVDAREKDPVAYIKVIGALMPKQIEQSQPLEDLNDDQLLAGIALLRSRLAENTGTGTAETVQ